ncbi:hypothetical protein N7486_007936 [Penicillium sp. IBT 16267x]|nr:hypothetical protein N7486_007936 [Penicillium sp. IBT 16267x]
MSSPAPLPIVICAMNDEMDKFDFLGVNVEVVHTIQGLEAAKQEIPHLLAGNDPQSAHIDNIGTHNYRPVRAIILGAISGVKDFKAIHELRNSLAGIAPEPVIWIVGVQALT